MVSMDLVDSSSNGNWLFLMAMSGAAFVAGWVLKDTFSSGNKTVGRKIKSKYNGAEEDDEEETEEDESSEDDESSINSSDVNDESGIFEDLKMVLCIRTDLGMGKGKIVAQACHAATGAIKTAERVTPKLCAKFWRGGSAKIALKCPSEEMMMKINAAAREAKLVTYVVCDAGRTQIAAGSKTVCAIGPAPVSAIDKITGRSGKFPLKLM